MLVPTAFALLSIVGISHEKNYGGEGITLLRGLISSNFLRNTFEKT